MIEILMVVGIIAFLATLVALRVFEDGEGAKAKTARAGVQMITTRAQSYYLDVGVLPNTMKDLLHKPTGRENWKGPYIMPSQSLDPWGREYMMQSPGEHGALDVVCLGSDGQMGGVGYAAEIGNWQ